MAAYTGSHPGALVSGVVVTDLGLVIDSRPGGTGRSGWQFQIEGTVAETDGATYMSAWWVSIDAWSGALRILGQG